MSINLTLVGQIISFAIFVWICMKFIWPPVINALHERQARIADGLAAAERGQHDLELAEKKATDLIKQAKTEAIYILSQARKQGNQLIEDAKIEAIIKRDRIVESGYTEVQRELNRAKQTLRGQIAGIVMTGAQRILEREVNAQDHKDVLDELASQI